MSGPGSVSYYGGPVWLSSWIWDENDSFWRGDAEFQGWYVDLNHALVAISKSGDGYGTSKYGVPPYYWQWIWVTLPPHWAGPFKNF